jgi:hypothetical protein
MVNATLSEFAAPDVLSDHKLTRKADVLALASILFSIVISHHQLGETGKQSNRAAEWRNRSLSMITCNDLFLILCVS